MPRSVAIDKAPAWGFVRFGEASSRLLGEVAGHPHASRSAPNGSSRYLSHAQRAYGCGRAAVHGHLLP